MNERADGHRDAASIEFNVDHAYGRSVHGWIWCPETPGMRLEVGLYSDGELLAQSVANQFREDLLAAHKGDGHCAFSIEVPASRKLPENGTLELRVAGRQEPIFAYQAPSLADFEYHVDSVDSEAVSGWIWQPGRATKRIIIDAFQDGVLLGSIEADEFRSDLKQAQKSDGHCAFTLNFRDLEGLTPPCRISLHVRDVGEAFFSCELKEKPSAEAGTSALQAFEYCVETFDSEIVSGWIWQPRRPSRRVVVDVKEGERLIGTVAADKFRIDLQEAGKSDGHCGFSVQLRDFQIKASASTISLHVRDIAEPFFSYERVTEPELEFNIDHLHTKGVDGWIWNPAAPTSRIRLELLSDEQVVAEAVADKFRNDLLQAGKGDGKCAFRLSFPKSLADGQLHKLALRVQGEPTPFHALGGLIVAEPAAAPPTPQGGNASAPAPDSLPQLRLDGWTAPYCTVVAMARNEALRAHATMRHFCALFDRIILIDHLSDDDTAAIVAGYRSPGGPEIHILRSEEPGYLQSQYMTAVTQAVLKSGEGDWLFYLDFDEFLPFKSKQDFHQSLVQHAEHSVISGPWINCATDLSSPEVESQPILKVSDLSSPYVKVGLNLKRLQGAHVVVEQGNHAVRIGDSQAFTGAAAFGFYHIPVLSQEQFARKLELGVKAYDALVDRSKQDGFHWYEMKRHLEQWGSTPQFIDQLQLRYGESIVDVLREEPRASRPIRLEFAMVPPRNPEPRYDALAITHDTLAERLLERLSAPRESHLQPIRMPACYSSLSGPARVTTEAERQEIVRRALLTSSRELELVVPSAWAGHEPFLFSLMEAMRPRRYVELGTHAGQSFFAACQHYKSEGNYGEAVAIDLWEGDHHAGFYEEKVFQDFRYLLNKYFPRCGRYIRSLFSDAVTAFEDSSIDLLHIDGLHTYEAVRDDYETWRPKVTDCGVILFHDTTEYQSDFGVWQFFQEIRGEAAASFNFQHSHGLGVMAFGTEDTNPAVSLLREMSSAQTLYERHYSNLGRTMWRSARFRYH